MSIVEALRRKFEALIPYMDEKLRRLWAASEAVALGKGGIKTVAVATGLSLKTRKTGIKELEIPFNNQNPLSFHGDSMPPVRRPGGGRKKLTETDPTLIEDLEKLIEPVTRGDPLNGIKSNIECLVRSQKTGERDR